jgi:SAM-dependent methyltransferase
MNPENLVQEALLPPPHPLPSEGAMPTMTRARSCPLCNSGREAWDLSAVTFGAGAFDRHLFSIYRCRTCGIGITDPVPSEAESHLLYEDRTSSDFQGDNSSVATALKNVVADRDVRTLVAGAQLRQPATKILDYACGNGAFALSLQRAFPDSAVWATDYHEKAPPMLSETQIHYAPYGDLPAHFDLILCRHVLEHTYDPVKFLESVRDLMSPGGVLLIEVPNLEAPLRKVFGKYWDGYYVPYHPIHFSSAALQQAAVHAGLVPERAGGAEMPKIGRSLRNVIGCGYNSALFAVGGLLHPLQFIARYFTGEPTCLRLWARKP